jgi:DNA-binding protein Alba
MSIDKNNIVIIGKKATMNYVIACLTLFNSGFQDIIIKARGQPICRAIETVEMLRTSFVKNLTIKKIDIGSMEYSTLGRLKNISTIEITLSKPIQTT